MRRSSGAPRAETDIEGLVATDVHGVGLEDVEQLVHKVEQYRRQQRMAEAEMARVESRLGAGRLVEHRIGAKKPVAEVGDAVDSVTVQDAVARRVVEPRLMPEQVHLRDELYPAAAAGFEQQFHVLR